MSGIIRPTLKKKNHMTAVWSWILGGWKWQHRDSSEGYYVFQAETRGVAWIRVMIKIEKGGRIVAMYRKDDLWDVYRDDHRMKCVGA